MEQSKSIKQVNLQCLLYLYNLIKSFCFYISSNFNRHNRRNSEQQNSFQKHFHSSQHQNKIHQQQQNYYHQTPASTPSSRNPNMKPKKMMHAPIHPGENYIRKHNDLMQQPNADDLKITQKQKRKPLPVRNVQRRGEWNRDDAIKAINLEQELSSKKYGENTTLVLKFPDPELNKEIVKSFSSSIDMVHFQQPSTPRYLFYQYMYIHAISIKNNNNYYF